jgi:maleylacetoacetate isomerase
LKLYDAARSSASYRVRIALHWKSLDFERVLLDLVSDDQHQPAYRATNPQGLVPTLWDGPVALTQSLAIIEYLDETRPEPPLLPVDPAARAHARALAQLVACDIHPINNLRVMRYLENTLEQGEAARLAWYQHWIAEGLGAFEAILARQPEPGPYCCGEAVSLPDLCLVPQMFNARRYGCPLDALPTLVRIDEACRELPAFRAAAP